MPSSNVPSTSIQLLKTELARLREEHFQALKREDFESMTLIELFGFCERRDRMITLAKHLAALTTLNESKRRKAKRAGRVIALPQL